MAMRGRWVWLIGFLIGASSAIVCVPFVEYYRVRRGGLRIEMVNATRFYGLFELPKKDIARLRRSFKYLSRSELSVWLDDQLSSTRALFDDERNSYLDEKQRKEFLNSTEAFKATLERRIAEITKFEAELKKTVAEVADDGEIVDDGKVGMSQANDKRVLDRRTKKLLLLSGRAASIGIINEMIGPGLDIDNMKDNLPLIKDRLQEDLETIKAIVRAANDYSDAANGNVEITMYIRNCSFVDEMIKKSSLSIDGVQEEVPLVVQDGFGLIIPKDSIYKCVFEADFSMLAEPERRRVVSVIAGDSECSLKIEVCDTTDERVRAEYVLRK